MSQSKQENQFRGPATLAGVLTPLNPPPVTAVYTTLPPALPSSSSPDVTVGNDLKPEYKCKFTPSTLPSTSFTFFPSTTPKRHCRSTALGITTMLAGIASFTAGSLILTGILNVGLLAGVNGLIFAGLSTAAAATGIGLIVLGAALVIGAAWYLGSLNKQHVKGKLEISSPVRGDVTYLQSAGALAPTNYP